MAVDYLGRSGRGYVIRPKCAPNGPRIAPVPPDPLELATGQIQFASSPDSRGAALQLLGRARDQFALRSTGQAFDLKVKFAVNSLGRTNHDGAWQMEDVFVPKQGHRWTATSASGYTTTSIAAGSKIYGDEALSAVPLRLLEARGVLFDPLQSPAYADQGSVRTASATFHGAAVTCLLLSRSKNGAPRLPAAIGKRPRNVSTPSPGCFRCIRKFPAATPSTTTRTPRNSPVTLCPAA